MKYVEILHKIAEDSDATKKEPHTLRNVGIGTVGTALAGAGLYGGYQAADTLKGLSELSDVKYGTYPNKGGFLDALFPRVYDRARRSGFKGADLDNVSLARRSYRSVLEDLDPTKLRERAEFMARDWDKVRGEGLSIDKLPPLRKDQLDPVLRMETHAAQARVARAGKRFADAYKPYKIYARALLRTHPKMLKLFKMLKLR